MLHRDARNWRLNPEDNNEAMITAVEDVADIDFDLNKILYFGDGVFAVPFGLLAGCLLDYQIFKADYSHIARPKGDEYPRGRME